MRKAGYFSGWAIAAGLLVWSILLLFPSEEKVIQKRMVKLAHAISFGRGASPLARLAGGNAVTEFFTPDVEINLSGLEGKSSRVGDIRGRDSLYQATLAARANLKELIVEFPELEVVMSKDRKSAAVLLTAVANVDGEKYAGVEELKMTLIKVDGVWLINLVESARPARK